MPATIDRIEQLSRIYRTPGWQLLSEVAGHIEAARVAVEEFRKQHPPGHRCLTCDHLREREEDLHPAGPFALLAAIEVTTWQFSGMLCGDIGLMRMLSRPRPAAEPAGVS